MIKTEPLIGLIARNCIPLSHSELFLRSFYCSPAWSLGVGVSVSFLPITTTLLP